MHYLIWVNQCESLAKLALRYLSFAADAMGTLALLGCLGAGSAYQQAPMRNTHKPEKINKDGEEQPLMNKAESRV